MTEHFQTEHELNLIEVKLFLEQCNEASAQSHQTLMRLHLIQEWLADLEKRAEKLSDRFRTESH
jgi:hypothetical protein